MSESQGQFQVSLEFALDGKAHVFFFQGTDAKNIRFARIDDLSSLDQLDAAMRSLESKAREATR